MNSARDDVVLLQLEVPVQASMAAARRARAAGARVLLNFAPFRDDALSLVREVTHLIVNEGECALVADALALAGGSLEARARSLAEKTAATVIVTLGRNGAFAVETGRILTASALPVGPVDTVGAGDTFCGYLAAGLGEGRALDYALRLAAAAGSLACMKAGAQPAIPRRDEVEAAFPTGAR